ncbi:MAG: hypothetical protein M1826_000543 [Phylliscum demangeonii]|nr:MAG: hypothetical protein M1826_000543 [Phylliscum demangeonii]
MPVQQARVKSVSSGDTLILSSINNPAQERMLSFAFVTAPRLKKEGDEPFAFQSRDFLRRLTVGKVIQFQVIYTISPPNSKTIELGRVLLSPTGPSLPELAVEKGWVKLREGAGRNEDSEEASSLLEKLKPLEARARADGAGLWSSPPAEVVQTEYDLADGHAFLEQWKGQEVDGIVEKVLSGDRLVMRLMTSPTKHVQAVLLVAGIRAPMAKRTGGASDGKEPAAEEGGEEARAYVAERLMQRTVKVQMVGITPQNQLVAVVRHPTNGNIAEHVLKDGLARCADFHSTMLGPDMAPLREAEKQAKQTRVGLFKNHAAAQQPNGHGSGAEAVVSRVQSADTVYVRNKAGVEKRVSLSSIRQPKPSDPAQAPFCADAKEFLRKKAIGKHVTVAIDGTRPPQEGFEGREMATITLASKNVGLMLVEAGWASVTRHRRDDDDRSPIYDELLAAEEAAQKAHKGMWAGKPPIAKPLTDASESAKTAKVHLSVLQRQKKVPAVVDFVKSGSRFTVVMARDGLRLTLVLSGIRAPRSARNASEPGEPFGREAHDFAARRCTQRDVAIDVESVDKVGGFIGTLYVGRENFARALLDEGLARVHAYSAEQSGHALELMAAEKRAQQAKKGLWHDWDPDADEEAGGQADGKAEPANGAASDASPATMTNGGATHPVPAAAHDYRDILVTHIDPATGRLKIQLVGPHTTAALIQLMTAFKAFHLSPRSVLPSAPRIGDLVAARFSADGEWYRARVRHNDRDQREAEVVYIDYGNSEKRAWADLRPLVAGDGPPEPDLFSTGALPAQALDAALAWVQMPAQPEYLADAVDWLAAATADRELVAGFEPGSGDGRGSVISLILRDPEAANGSGSVRRSVNAEMVAQGWALVPPVKKRAAWSMAGAGAGAGMEKKAKEEEDKEEKEEDVLAVLMACQDEAKKERRGVWEYGDLTEDE